jgi:iron complex outermembrane receptor protein
MRAPIGAILDLRVRNMTALHTSGIDLLTKTELPIGRGKVGGEIGGTYLFAYEATEAPGLPFLSLLNRQSEPINLRLRGSGYWQYQGLQLSTTVVYANRYRDWASNPARNIASWTTADLTINYDLDPAGRSALANTRLSLSALNVFNRMPPFVNNIAASLGYDQENGDLLGRFVSLSLRKRW